jgi:alpha-methylacyl-CoA racemase
MTGWGQTGPWAQRAGHDITYAAVSGTLHALGAAERPVAPVPVIGDFAGGSMYLVVGVLAALIARGTTGRGQVVDAARVDGAAHLFSMVHGLLGVGGWRDEREANLLDGGAPFYAVYECADGRFVAVGALEPPFWAELVAGLGVEVVGEQYDPATWPAQRAAFTTAFRTRTRDEWAAHFAATDACVAPVLSLAEAPSHPHLVARGTFAPDAHGHPVPRTGPRLSATPPRDPGPEPVPGADTTAYLLAHGFSEAEVTSLIASGAVVQA